VVVWGGQSRLAYHGVAALADGDHPPAGTTQVEPDFSVCGLSVSLGISMISLGRPRIDRMCLRRNTPYLAGRCSAQSLLPSGSRR
jgi:hypothetical protein